MILNTGGASTGLIVATGTVGIGTITPAYTLDVNGVINATDFYKNGLSFSGGSQWITTGNDIYYNLGNVGIGTTGPGAKLHIKNGGAKIEVISAGTTGTYSLNWNALQICQFGTCCPPWKDCDGDGATYMAGTDCDEGCNSCYVGSTAITYTPDGRDQNCNGIVDESEAKSKTCKFPDPPGSNGILASAVQSVCNSWCGEAGAVSGNGPYTNPYRDLWTGANFSNCDAWGAAYYEIADYFATAQTITCTCSSLQYR